MSNTSKELKDELKFIDDPIERALVKLATIKQRQINPHVGRTMRQDDEVMEAYALITQQLDKALEQARSKDPHKCEYGHEVYSHNTASGWCCACEADQAFMENEIERRIATLKQQLKDKE